MSPERQSNRKNTQVATQTATMEKEPREQVYDEADAELCLEEEDVEIDAPEVTTKQHKNKNNKNEKKNSKRYVFQPQRYCPK